MTGPNPPSNPFQGLTQEQALATMRQLQADEEPNPFLMGQLCNSVASSQLLQGTPYKSAADFFCGQIPGLSLAALLRYGAVAREFSQEVVERFGITRLELLLSYRKGAHLMQSSEEPGSTFILVPQDNGDLQPKRFVDCSTRELRKALEHLGSPGSYLPISPADRARYDLLCEAILHHFPKGVRVLMRNHEGTTLLSFEGIPVSKVPELAAVVRMQLQAMSERPEEEEMPQPN
ncbi:hypothetical protein [Hyalangium sp.]|uniref:hypothetical protein n=1 Tax=Hyalangium sp. TaxID=2028555 RepID=UPI002D2BC41B|nr:hypothetical protein [Hyalangium sp.]HYI01945.1 hypothetical protein [Hyalangium sp.]